MAGDTMKLIFMRRDTLACRAIRWFTFSDWSHVAAMFDDRVYESKAIGGVRKTDILTATEGTTRVKVCRVAGIDDKAAEEWAASQIGKPYDWSALWGLLIRRDIQDDDAWDCSEFGFVIALHGGRQLVREPGNRVTPQKLLASPWVEPEAEK